MEFVPLWTDILEGPCWKIMDLPAEQYRFWTFCLLAAQKYDHVDGHLPDDRTLAHWCQMDRDTCIRLRDALVVCGLIDRVTSAGHDRDMPVTGHNPVTNTPRDVVEFRVHDWDQWRLAKDSGAKNRKRAQRQREKGLKPGVTDESRDGHGPVTAPSQDVTPQHSAFSIQHSTNNTPPTPSKGGSACADEDLEPFQSPAEPPQAAWNAEQRRVLEKATKWWGASNGDSIVGGLLDLYPAAMVDEAIDSHHGKVDRRIDRGRLEGLCRKIYDDGNWKPRMASKFGKGGDVPPPTTKRYNIVAGP